MRSFVKIKLSRNGEITLLFTDVVEKLCSSREFLTEHLCHWTYDEPLSDLCTINSKIFARVWFSRNFADAKFRENKTIAKWRNHSFVYWCSWKIMLQSWIFNIANMPSNVIVKNKILAKISEGTVLALTTIGIHVTLSIQFYRCLWLCNADLGWTFISIERFIQNLYRIYT